MSHPVLFLDIAAHTGWALWEGASRVRYGSFTVPAGRLGRRTRGFVQWLDGMMRVVKPGRVGIEAPLLRADGKTTLDTVYLLMGLATHAHTVAEGRDVAHVTDENIMQIRVHFIGTARGERQQKKAETIAVCKALGWDPKNDNEADALAGLHYVLHKYRYPHTLGSTALFAPRREAAA